MRLKFHFTAIITFSIAMLAGFNNVVAQAPPTPNNVYMFTYGCGSTTVMRENTPPPGANYDYYWQTSASGTSTTLGTSPSIVRTTTGNLYLRSRLKASPFTWSTSSQSVVNGVVYVYTTTPAAPAGNNISVCPNASVMVSAASQPGAAINHKWYTGTSGSATEPHQRIISTSEYVTLSGIQKAWASNTTYYVAAVNGCGESARTPVSVAVQAVSGTPTVSGNHRFGPGMVTLTASGAPAGGTYNWYSPGNVLLATGSTYAPAQGFTSSVSNYAYVKLVGNGGCEGVAAWVNIAVYPLPVITASSQYIIKQQPVILTTQSGYDSYEWRNPSGTIVSTSENYSANGVGVYTLTVTKSGLSATTSIELKSQFSDLNLNYIIETTALTPNISSASYLEQPVQFVQEAIQYFDGLGRPMQTVTTQGSPTKKDIVQPIVYDAYGREHKKYLPFTAQSDGWYKPTDQIIDPASGHYTGIAQPFYATGSSNNIADDTRPFGETVFEASPLSRPLKSYGPGSDWAAASTNNPGGKNKYIEHQYLGNIHGTTTSVTAEKVIAWKINSAGMPVREAAFTGNIETGGYYSTGQLSVNVTVDEQLNAVREYTNKKGQVILKKVQAISPSTNLNNTTQWAMTYYLYDDFGNLRYVFPPELSKLVHNNADTYTVMATDLTNWAFQYKYDARKRMIEKRVPGADWVYMVYDDRDRLVLTQDGNQRSAKYWAFTKYDVLNRPIATGIKDTAVALTQTEMQNAVNGHYAKSWTIYGETYIGNATGNVHGYTNKSYPVMTGPTTTIDPNRYTTVTYYDNYDFRSQWSGAYEYHNDALSQTVNGVIYSQPAAASTFVIGQVTGTMVKVLDGGVTGRYTWLKSVSYYDDKYRLIQGVGDNYRGGLDRSANLYDFTGKILSTKTTHTEYSVLWTAMVNATTNGNRLFKSTTGAGWNTSGAVSQQQLAAGQDGWMEITASETSLYRMVGLSDQNSDNDYKTIDYAFNLQINGVLVVYENSSPRLTVPGGYTTGDLLKIERTGSTIKYYRNNGLVHTSTVPSSTALMVDAALYNANSSIVNARSSFSIATQRITRKFEYDHAGRLTNVWHQLNEDPVILLAHNEYNELGQLIDKKLHSTVAEATNAKQSVDYRYNIRGWLTSVNDASLTSDGVTNDDTGDYFGMNLGYNTDIGTGNPSLHNGNISAMRWSNFLGQASVKEKSYTYGYDPMNRLTGATFKEKTANWNAAASNGFSESGYMYDLNGNILSLTRHDKRGSVTIMDNLAYDYGSTATQSNRLLKVTDAGDDFAGFIDGTNSSDDYAYDANGNMITDQNKGITTAITYNFLNLPEVVTRGGNTVRYIYDATGRKLAQVVAFNGATKQTDYCGEFTYENDVLQFISHEEGRIVVASTKLIYTNPGESITDITASNATLTTVTQNGTEKYVKAVSNGTVARTGMFPVGGTYPVVAGERYRIRAKGYRDKGTAASSSVAYLLIKVNGTDLAWPGAALPLSLTTAQTESWIEQTVTIPAGATTLQAGVVWNTVLAGEIIYLNEFEITKLESTAPEYQYNLKDHFGNVRLTFTTKNETETSLATMETSNAAVEQGKFLYYNEAIKVDFAPFDHTNAGPTYYSTRLTGGSTNAKYGLTKTLSVMPGDTVNMEVHAKYLDPASTNWTAALNNFITAINGGTAPAGTIVDGGAAGSIGGGTYPISPINHAAETGTPPKAYLNYIVFDRTMTTVLDVGYSRITANSREYGQDGAHDRLTLNYTAKEPGYIYIYLSNDNPTAVEVYFDDFKVEHIKSPVVQMDDYYPFGLTFNSCRRENSVPNRWKFQGQEHVDNLGLNWDSFKWRNHQPDIGRFFNVDPLAEKFPYNSPYAFAENKLGLGIELEGLELVPFHVLETTRAAISGFLSGKGMRETEQGVVIDNPIGATMIYVAENQETAERFAQESQLPGLHNGTADALRHSTFSALMTRTAGEKTAKAFGDAHEEDRPGQPSSEKTMDLHNNSVGRKVALDNPDATVQQLVNLLVDMIENGQLKTLDSNGNVTNSSATNQQVTDAKAKFNSLDENGNKK